MTDNLISPALSATTVAVDQRTLEKDLACIHCGYNLRSQPFAGVCSECGSPVADSLRPNLLRDADPKWFKQVLIAIPIILLAYVSTIGVDIFELQLIRFFSDDQFYLFRRNFYPADVLVLSVGLWLISAKNKTFPVSSKLVRWRLLTRRAVACGMLLSAMYFCDELFPYWFHDKLMYYSSLILTLTTSVAMVANAVYLSGLAGEVGRSKLRRSLLIIAFAMAFIRTAFEGNHLLVIFEGNMRVPLLYHDFFIIIQWLSEITIITFMICLSLFGITLYRAFKQRIAKAA